jgi:hypothetical protein
MLFRAIDISYYFLSFAIIVIFIRRADIFFSSAAKRCFERRRRYFAAFATRYAALSVSPLAEAAERAAASLVP